MCQKQNKSDNVPTLTGMIYKNKPPSKGKVGDR